MMVELMELVIRLIKVQAEIASFDSPQRYMIQEAAELETQIMRLAQKLELLK
jgi:hypothetical protein